MSAPNDPHNPADPSHEPFPEPMAEEEATIIIDPEDEAAAPGYAVRPRHSASETEEPFAPSATEDAGFASQTEDAGFAPATEDAGFTPAAQEPAPTEAAGVPDPTDTEEEELVVLLIDDDEGNDPATQMMAPDEAFTNSEEWGSSVETLSDGSGAGFSSVTEFLDNDDPFAGSGTDDVPATLNMNSGGDTEEVRLLSAHPSFGGEPIAEDTVTLDGMEDLGDLEGLPDLENVEDITTLLEDVSSSDLSHPSEGLDDVEIAFDPVRTSSPMKRLVGLAAVAAIAVAGVLWGPGLYEEYVAPAGSNVALNKPPVSIPDVPDVDPGNGETPDGGGETPPPEAEVPFRNWVSDAIAQSLPR